MNSIYILWLRQLKRYFRSRSRIIGSLGQPILFLVAFGFGLGPTFAKAGQGNYLEFIAPGIISMSILFTAIFSGIEIIWDRQFGFLKEVLVAPVTRWQIMIGRTLGGATVAVFQGLIVLILSLFFGFKIETFALIPQMLIFMILIALFFTALGTAIASILEDMQGFQLIMNFLIMPIFFLSGALFPLTGLPKAIQTVVSINPLSYGVDGLRGAVTGVFNFGLSTDLLILSIATIILIGIGTYLFNKIQI
jgi:ABC-2 type transport system permease protein